MGRNKASRPKGRFTLRKDNGANKEGLFPIYINYSVDRKIASYPTTIWVSEKDWDAEKQMVLKSESQHIRYNNFLDKKKSV